MANKNLFISTVGRLLPRFSTRNEAGGAAYALTPEQALAQYAATGCVNGTFYATAETQLEYVLQSANQVEPEFVARVALYCRTKAHMKDMPALLLAVLSVRSPGLMAEIFDRVVDSPKMLRNFVQIMRSGVVGRKSLGTLPKRMIVQWLESRTDRQLFMGSTGGNPSLADIVKMVHPKPASPARGALYAYLIGKAGSPELLPNEVRAYERFKAEPGSFAADQLPDAPMEMLAGLKLQPEQWTALARSASWQRLRMNLNTFARHGVFKDQAVAEAAAAKLRDPQEIAKARVFPYQLLVAYTNVNAEVPATLKEALQDAMEIAIAGVPTVSGQVWVFPDVSGSMQSPVTGRRKGSTTAVRCVDVAALVAAAFVRRNPSAQVVPFSDEVVHVELNRRDSVMTNAQKLAALPSGGTNCSAPLAYLNARGLKGDLLVYVSDNESWMDSPLRSSAQPTRTLLEWQRFKQSNPHAKLVCLDVQPYGSTQAPGRADILNIGGFADTVFTAIAEFSNSSADPDFWVSTIQKENL